MAAALSLAVLPDEITLMGPEVSLLVIVTWETSVDCVANYDGDDGFSAYRRLLWRAGPGCDSIPFGDWTYRGTVAARPQLYVLFLCYVFCLTGYEHVSV